MKESKAMRFFRIDDYHPLTGGHVLVIVSLFFGTIIAVNITLAIFAVSTFPGLVVKNSYVASQNYNALLAEAEAQAQSGLHAQLTHRAGVLGFRLGDGSGVSWRKLDVIAHAGRPASGSDDRTIALRESGDFYQAKAALPAGRWIVDVEARNGDTLVFRHTERVWIEAAENSWPNERTAGR